MPIPLSRNAGLGCLLMIAALAGTGCSDQTAPAGADDGAAAGSPVEARKGSHAPIISNLDPEGSLFITNGVATVYVDVTLTNPGGKLTGLSFEGLVEQGQNSVTMNSILPLRCSDSEGTLPHGTCITTAVLTAPDGGLTAGSARLTVSLLKDGVWIAGQYVFVDVYRP